MQVLYCWRCGCDVPMLDEAEFVEIHALYWTGLRSIKEVKAMRDNPMLNSIMEERFRPVLDAYERLTGFREPNVNAIMHHRIAQYGPACATCGKPLRTLKASQCMACGTVRGA